jgi:repressor LexA
MIPGASRGIRLVGEQASGIPIIGRVAAGNPVLAEANIEDHCSLESSFFSPRADYLLRVTGDSMVNAGIHDGDLLAVHSTPIARDNDIIVARIDDEVTVKRLQRPSPHQIKLVAENDDFDPILVDLREREFAIEGISVGVIRRNS